MKLVIANIIVLALFFGIVVFFGAPYVPTRKKWASAAMNLAKVGPNDTVVDLGSGDGIILKMAAERGARAIGYEINPILVAFSWLRLRKVRRLVSVKLRNFWRVDLPKETSVIYVFIESRDLRRLRKYLEAQKRVIAKDRKVKVVSFGFEIPNVKVSERLDGMNLYEF